MKLNSLESIKTAAEVFRNYGYSWTSARLAGQRDENGILVIPKTPPKHKDIKIVNSFERK